MLSMVKSTGSRINIFYRGPLIRTFLKRTSVFIIALLILCISGKLIVYKNVNVCWKNYLSRHANILATIEEYLEKTNNGHLTRPLYHIGKSHNYKVDHKLNYKMLQRGEVAVSQHINSSNKKFIHIERGLFDNMHVLDISENEEFIIPRLSFNWIMPFLNIYFGSVAENIFLVKNIAVNDSLFINANFNGYGWLVLLATASLITLVISYLYNIQYKLFNTRFKNRYLNKSIHDIEVQMSGLQSFYQIFYQNPIKSGDYILNVMHAHSFEREYFDLVEDLNIAINCNWKIIAGKSITIDNQISSLFISQVRRQHLCIISSIMHLLLINIAPNEKIIINSNKLDNNLVNIEFSTSCNIPWRFNTPKIEYSAGMFSELLISFDKLPTICDSDNIYMQTIQSTDGNKVLLSYTVKNYDNVLHLNTQFKDTK